MSKATLRFYFLSRQHSILARALAGLINRPSEHPDRREFVIVNIELPDGKGEVNLYPIIREGDAKPRLGQFQIFPRQPVQGMLSDFLPEKNPTEAERIIAASLLQRTGRVLHQFPFQITECTPNTKTNET
jgi:hypothetical protein